MTFIVVGLFAFGGVAFVGYLIFDFKKGLSSTQSILDKGLIEIVSSLNSLELSDWDLNELNLISRVGDSDIKKSLYTETEIGVIYSIYQEPLLGFAVKSYLNTNKKIYAFKWNNVCFSVISENDKLLIYKNQETFGKIELNDKLILNNHDNEYVSIDIYSKQSLIPVLYNNTEIIRINSDDSMEVDHTRVLNEVVQSENHIKELFIVGLGYAIVEQLI